MNQDPKIEEINLLDLFDRFKESKKAFLFTSLSFLFVAFLITKFIWPKYTVKSAIQIQAPDIAGEQTTDLIYGTNKKTSAEIAVDEAVAIRSFPIMLKAMDSLNFHVSYYVDAFFADEEIYNSTPFTIQFNKSRSTFIPYNEKFSIEKVENGNYHIKGSYEDENNTNYDIDTTLSAKQWVHLKTFYLQIVPDTNYIERPDAEKESILFAFTDINELIFEIDEELTIAPKDKNSSVLEINLATSLPDKYTDFVNLIQELYLQQSLDEKTVLARNSLKYIQEELKGISDSLEMAEKDLQDYQITNKIANASDEAQRVSETIDKLEAEKSSLTVKNRYYEYLQNYFQDTGNSEKLVSPAAFGIADVVLNDLTKQLSDLQTQKNTLLKEGKTKNPEYKTISEKIESLKSTLKNNVENFNVSNNILLSDVERRLVESNALIAKLPISDRMIVKIQRNVSLSQNLYMLLQEKKSQAETILKASSPSSRIIDPAHLLSSDPNFPLWLTYPLMFVLAILSVITGILGKDFLGRKVINKKIVTSHISIPCIGNLPLEENINLEELIANPIHEISEAGRIILYNTLNLSKENNKSILITSAIDGEGKSFLSSLLSIVSTYGQKRTLLICADIRRPTLHESFHISRTPGLTEYLSGKENINTVIQKSGLSNLDIVSSGNEVKAPGMLFENGRLASLIEFAATNYDKIIIDTPPISMVADAFYIAQHCDISLVVIRKNYSTIEGLKDIEEAYKANKLPNPAYIYNGTPSGNGYYYGNKKKKYRLINQ